MKKIQILGLLFILLDMILLIIQSFIEMKILPIICLVLASLFTIGVLLIELPSLNFKEYKKRSIIAILLELPLLISISIFIFYGIIGIDFWGIVSGVLAFLLLAVSYGKELYPITILFVACFITSIVMIIRMRKK